MGLLLLVPTVLAACVFWDIQYTALLTLATVVAALVPFFLYFEKGNLRPRDIMPVVVLSALAVAGRMMFQPFPSFMPVSAIVILAGASFGRQSGFLTGALSAAVSNMFLGQGPWTPWQMYAWGVIGYLAGTLAAHGVFRRGWTVYVFGLLSAILYGWILDSWYIIGFIHPLTWGNALLAYLAGFPFTMSHAIATVVFLIPIYKPWSKKLSRIKRKYGMMMPEKGR